MPKLVMQPYPRVENEHSPFVSCLDDSTLVDHPRKITKRELNEFILSSIHYAEQTSSRDFCAIGFHPQSGITRLVFRSKFGEIIV